MTSYTLPGYFDERTARNVCARLAGKTFYNFSCSYTHGVNSQITIQTNLDVDQKEFENTIINRLVYLAAAVI